MIFIDLQIEDYPQELAQELERVAVCSLDTLGIPSTTDVAITVVNDISIHELNLKYRGIDAPTDVLSFESKEIDPETGHLFLGDVIISIDTASRQSTVAGHALIAEIQLLSVHGILHLGGYDHDTESSKQAMWAIQSEILDAMKININRLPEND